MQNKKLHRLYGILTFDSYQIPIQMALSRLRLYPKLTVEEHLKLFLSIIGLPYNEYEESLVNNLNLFAITKSKLGAQLSNSESKLVMYILLLSLKPKIFLLDEPRNGLSESQYQKLKRILFQEKKNDSVLVITTTCREEACYFGDKIGKLRENKNIVLNEPILRSMSNRFVFSPSVDENIRKDSKLEFVSHKASIDSVFRNTFRNSGRMKKEMGSFQSSFFKSQTELGTFMLQNSRRVQFFTILKTIVRNSLRNCRSIVRIIILI